MALVAILDACVLYPAPLRDLLMRLAVEGTFQARWSERIHREWITAACREAPQLDERLERTRQLMDEAIPGALVEGWEQFESLLELPDANDRHVLAAAIAARADTIVTFNLKDFPEEPLSPWGIEARHPDQFIADILETDEALAFQAVRRHWAALRNPAKTPEEYLQTLKRQQLTAMEKLIRCQRATIFWPGADTPVATGRPSVEGETPNDTVLRQEPGFTIGLTDIASTAVPYPPIRRDDGKVNFGFVDLRNHPERAEMIPEVVGRDGMAEVLRVVNEVGSQIMSLGCEQGVFDCPPGSMIVKKLYFSAYVQITLVDHARNSNPNNLLNLAEDIMYRIAPSDTYSTVYEMSVEPLKIFFGALGSFALLIKIFGYGDSEREAYESFEFASSSVAGAIERLRAESRTESVR